MTSPGGLVPERPLGVGDLVKRKVGLNNNSYYKVKANPFVIHNLLVVGRDLCVVDRFGQRHVVENLERVYEVSEGEYVLSAEQIRSIGGREALKKMEEMTRGGVVPGKPSHSGEVRTTSASGGEKGVKPEDYALLPGEALDEIARVYAFGANKYAAHNWRKGYEWSKSFSALMRHLWLWWRGEDLDPESGLSHLGHAGFHILGLLTFAQNKRYSNYDDRYREDSDAGK